MALLMPALAGARETAKTTACLSNLRQMVVGERMYLTEDNSACLRLANQSHYAYTGGTWWGPGQLYALSIMSAPKVAYCPSLVGDWWAYNASRWSKDAPQDPITFGYVYRRWLAYGWCDYNVDSDGDLTPTSRVTLKTAPDGLALYADVSLMSYKGSLLGANVTLEHNYNNAGNVGYADGHVETWTRRRIDHEGKGVASVNKAPWPFYEEGFISALDLPGAHPW